MLRQLAQFGHDDVTQFQSFGLTLLGVTGLDFAGQHDLLEPCRRGTFLDLGEQSVDPGLEQIHRDKFADVDGAHEIAHVLEPSGVLSAVEGGDFGAGLGSGECGAQHVDDHR